MACGNPLLKINQVRCDSKKTSRPDGPSICSRTQSPHTPLTGTTTVRSAQPLRKPDKNGTKKKSKQFLTSAAEPYSKKICDHWSACIHLNWRYKNEQLTTSQMEHSEFKFPTEWLNGDSDEFATVTPTKTVEKPPADHYLTHFPKHLGCESCFKAKTQKKPHRRKGEDPKFMPLPKPMKFGDTITADHLSFLANATNPNEETGLHLECLIGTQAGSIAFRPPPRTPNLSRQPCRNSSDLTTRLKTF